MNLLRRRVEGEPEAERPVESTLDSYRCRTCHSKGFCVIMRELQGREIVDIFEQEDGVLRGVPTSANVYMPYGRPEVFAYACVYCNRQGPTLSDVAERITAPVPLKPA